jgi:hypothetical protein
MPPKTCRGQILDYLNRIYPAQTSGINVVGVFYEYFKDTEIRRSLQFLTDKGYVEKTTVHHPIKRGKSEDHYKITPSGIEIIEGTKTDPSIVLEADHQEDEV